MYNETEDVFGGVADGPGGGVGDLAVTKERDRQQRYGNGGSGSGGNSSNNSRQIGEGSTFVTNQNSRHLLDNKVKMQLIFTVILGLVHAAMVLVAGLNLYKIVPIAQHEVMIWTSGAVAIIDLLLSWVVSHGLWAPAFISTSAAFTQFAASSLGYADWNNSYWLLGFSSLVIFLFAAYSLLQMVVHHKLSTVNPDDDETLLHGLAGEDRDEDMDEETMEDQATTLDDEGVELVEEFFNNVTRIPRVWTYLCTEMESRTCDVYSNRRPACISSPETCVWGLSLFLCVRLLLLAQSLPCWIQPDRYGVDGSRWTFVLAYSLFWDILLAFLAGLPPWAFLGGATVSLVGAAQMGAVTSGGVGGGQATLLWLGAHSVILVGFGINELLVAIGKIRGVGEVKKD